MERFNIVYVTKSGRESKRIFDNYNLASRKTNHKSQMLIPPDNTLSNSAPESGEQIQMATERQELANLRATLDRQQEELQRQATEMENRRGELDELRQQLATAQRERDEARRVPNNVAEQANAQNVQVPLQNVQPVSVNNNDFSSIISAIALQNVWSNSRYRDQDISFVTYYYKQLKQANYILPKMQEYEKNYIIAQQFPFWVKEALASVNFECVKSMSQTLAHLDVVHVEKQRERERT